MRTIGMLLLVAWTVDCRSPESVVEPGAVLLQVECDRNGPAPDELRVWAWDDGGSIWDSVRFPSSGSLPRTSGQDLGTILLHPNSIQGSLKVYIRGFAQGVRVGDGTVVIASLTGSSRVFTIILGSSTIDDCPMVPSADKGICPGANSSDAGTVPHDGNSSLDLSFDSSSDAYRPGKDAETDGRTPNGGSGAQGTGGTSGAGGDSLGQGLGGATGTGGVASGGGVVSSGGTQTGGADGGMGGATASGGAKGSGGSTGKATPPPVPTLPGTACTTESSDANCHSPGSLCYKYCGPESQGYKSLSCTGGKYVEGSCTFSSVVAYTCYALTSVAPCATTPPTSGASCSIEDCKTCGSSTSTGYYDGTKTAKIGYCVCSEGKWSCASVGAWPCPGKTGC